MLDYGGGDRLLQRDSLIRYDINLGRKNWSFITFYDVELITTIKSFVV
jgi:hypothetical protein